MYTDIKRICENPTAEDREWFPGLAGTPWLPAPDHAMRNFKDESFIGQYRPPSTTTPATAACANCCHASTT